MNKPVTQEICVQLLRQKIDHIQVNITLIDIKNFNYMSDYIFH